MRRAILLAFLITFSSIGFGKKFQKREFRAAWIATVANIDWPSKAGLSVDDQKAELVAILDDMKAANMNAVIMQIRPSTDAFYKSNMEPWSQWLTGKQGKNPKYDPLAFAIAEAHKRCMEFHAWFNPYRAVFNYKKTKVSKNHITTRYPEWFVEYGRHKYFNPGLKQTRDYVSTVVADVVRRYDIDAVHFDDYFYPYRIPKKEFPDENAFKADSRGFAANEKEAWRRDNVDLIIQQLRDSIKSVKPYVQFGISPFGVWRNKSKDKEGSDTKAGQTNYDDLYADVLKWLENDWIDYVTPQVYWHIGHKAADYATLVDWWSDHSYNKNLYIGHGLYRLSTKSKDMSWRSAEEVARQVMLNRKYKKVSGSSFYSAKFIRKNKLGVSDLMHDQLFPYVALCPTNDAIKGEGISAPFDFDMEQKGDTMVFDWKHKNKNELDKARYYVVYEVKGGRRRSVKRPQNIVAVTTKTHLEFQILKRVIMSNRKYCVTAVNRLNEESNSSGVLKIAY